MDSNSWLLLEREDPRYCIPADLRERDALAARDIGWVEQMRPFVQHFSAAGGLVLDPFAGFGTTLLAAHLEGRRSIGVELDAARAALARERLHGHGVRDAQVLAGDLRALGDELPPVDLCLTSLPYFGATAPPDAPPQQLYGQAQYEPFLEQLHDIFRAVRRCMKPGGHVIVMAENLRLDGRFVPLAWDAARVLAGLFVLREERVLLYRRAAAELAPGAWQSNRSHEYALIAEVRREPLDVAAALALWQELKSAGHVAELRGSLARRLAGDLGVTPVDMDLKIDFDVAALHALLQFLAERGFALRCWQAPLRLPADLAALRDRHYVRAERLERDGRRLVVDVGWS
ncbi:site-specific DNA-methyltransferase [Tahibacter caeni]|uniref:site-specific DNA-methyltransferase n=1 Tax=Tahibacter caeni TaxID=1453545 RepID=UPI00214941FE|nr:site-specific DNA-methyltransferase [Tahibacter caeni]